MDLKDFEPKSDTLTISLLDSNGNPIADENSAFTIDLYKAHTTQARKVLYELNDRAIERKRDAKTEEVYGDYYDKAARLTAGWDLIYDGAPLPFSVEKARELYEKFPWIIEQVYKAINESESDSFMKP